MNVVAALKLAEVGLVESFQDDVKARARRDLGDGQAGAVDGDALAEANIGPRRGKRKPSEEFDVGHADHLGGFFNDSGEHGGKV